MAKYEWLGIDWTMTGHILQMPPVIYNVEIYGFTFRTLLSTGTARTPLDQWDFFKYQRLLFNLKGIIVKDNFYIFKIFE